MVAICKRIGKLEAKSNSSQNGKEKYLNNEALFWSLHQQQDFVIYYLHQGPTLKTNQKIILK